MRRMMMFCAKFSQYKLYNKKYRIRYNRKNGSDSRWKNLCNLSVNWKLSCVYVVVIILNGKAWAVVSVWQFCYGKMSDKLELDANPDLDARIAIPLMTVYGWIAVSNWY